MTSSAARDVAERYSYALSFHDINVPSAESYPGPRFVQVFLQTVEAVAEWMTESP